MSVHAIDDHDATVHRALADPSRLRILEALRDGHAALDARELALRVGLHPNTVRSHVRILEQAGLVRARSHAEGRPGRPHIVYEAIAGEQAPKRPGGYKLLAEILASSLASRAGDAAAEAEAAGRVWGQHLVERPPPFAATSPRDAVERVVRLLSDFGFDPQVELADNGDHVLVMHSCPFGEVAQEYLHVVCPVHKGLLQGALDGLGSSLSTDELAPNAGPGTCVARLSEHR